MTPEERRARVADVRAWRDDTRHLFGPGGEQEDTGGAVPWRDADALLAELDARPTIAKEAIEVARKALMAASLLAEGYGKTRTAAFFDEARDGLEGEGWQVNQRGRLDRPACGEVVSSAPPTRPRGVPAFRPPAAHPV